MKERGLKRSCSRGLGRAACVEVEAKDPGSNGALKNATRLGPPGKSLDSSKKPEGRYRLEKSLNDAQAKAGESAQVSKKKRGSWGD